LKKLPAGVAPRGVFSHQARRTIFDRFENKEKKWKSDVLAIFHLFDYNKLKLTFIIFFSKGT